MRQGVDPWLRAKDHRAVPRRQLLKALALLTGAGSVTSPSETLAAQFVDRPQVVRPTALLKPPPRVPKEIVERFKKIATPNVWQIAQTHGLNCFTSAVRPVAPGMKLCGPAVTMRLIPVQNANNWNNPKSRDYEHTVHTLSRLSEPGDVHVIDMGGYMDESLFGGNAAEDAKYFGVAGVVIDGVSRDLEQVMACGMPVFARGTVAPHAHGKFRTANLNDEPVQVGSISIDPGDIVIGDAEGLCVVPADRAEELLVQCEKLETNEAVSTARWRKGEDSPGPHHQESLDMLDPSQIRNVPKGVPDPRKK